MTSSSMVTDQLTKTQFIVEVLNRDVSNIFKAQRLIAEKNIRLQGAALKEKKRAGKTIGTRSGKMLQALQNPQFSVAASNGKFQVQAYIPLQMRFFDMKKLGNWMIYNRQVWGILYRQSMLNIKYGYGRQLRDTLGTALDAAFKSK